MSNPSSNPDPHSSNPNPAPPSEFPSSLHPSPLTTQTSSPPSPFTPHPSLFAAPTPDNNQPWLVEADGNAIRIGLDRDRLLPSDVDGMFDLIGLGAALTNVYLASTQQHQTVEVQIEDADGQWVAPPESIAAVQSIPGAGALADEIYRRHTNRKPYARRPIDPQLLRDLAQTATGDPPHGNGIRVQFLTDRAAIRKFGSLVARCDRLRFEYRAFHEELFKQLRFSAREADETRDGLDVRTLELPPGAKTFLRSLKHWSVMRAFKALGGTRLLAIPSHVSVIRSGAIGLISFGVPKTDRSEAGDSPGNPYQLPLDTWRRQCMIAGAALQRLWLRASALGLAIQPLGSLPLFFARLHRLDGTGLTPSDQQVVTNLEQRYRNMTRAPQNQVLAMAVRIGQATPAKFRSKRRSP